MPRVKSCYAALRMAMSESREEENQLKEHFALDGIRTAAAITAVSILMLLRRLWRELLFRQNVKV